MFSWRTHRRISSVILKIINEFTLICPMGTGTCVKIADWGTSGEILKKSLETVSSKNPGMDIFVGLKNVVRGM